MPKLHIVGITDDHRGLVLSERARSKTGDLLLEINDALMAAISEARRQRLATETNALVSNALPTRRSEQEDLTGRGASRLSPREIQRRLRMGESIASVARRAGVDEAWVERFAPPVEAEQARVIDRVRALVYVKPRLGPSSAPLGEAVLANVFDRGVPLTLAESEDAWSAFQRRDDVWCIRFVYASRGRRQTAEWDYFADGNELAARNRLAAELSYLDARQRRRRRSLIAEPEAEAAPARGAAKSRAAKPKAKKAAKKRAPAKKKVAARRAPAKRAGAKRAPAKKKVAARRTVAKRAPAKRVVAKRAPAKKKVAARRAPAKRAPAKRAPAKKKVAARRAPAKRAPAKRAPVRRTVAKRAPVKRAPARRTVAKRAPAKRVAKRAPAKRAVKRTASRRTPAKRGTARATKRAHSTPRPLVTPRSTPRGAQARTVTRRSPVAPRTGATLDVGDW